MGRSALRVCRDREAFKAWDPRRDLCKPFYVPLRASSLEIVGDDAEGTRLLVGLATPEEMATHAGFRAAADGETVEGCVRVGRSLPRRE
jgi:hypothetical protein